MLQPNWTPWPWSVTFFLIIYICKGSLQIRSSWMHNFGEGYKRRKCQNKHDENYKVVNIWPALYSYALQANSGIDFNTTPSTLYKPQLTHRVTQDHRMTPGIHYCLKWRTRASFEYQKLCLTRYKHLDNDSLIESFWKSQVPGRWFRAISDHIWAWRCWFTILILPS